MYYLEFKKIQFISFLWKFSIKYTIIRIFLNSLYFPFPTLRIYTILCPSENFLARSSRSTVTNITNTHSHSQRSPFLLFYQPPLSYFICSKSDQFHSFPNSHDRRQLTVIMLSEYGWKCSWHITVRDHYWMISVDWNQNFSLCNSFCLSTISTYLHSITFVNQHRSGGRIPYWLGRSR